MDVENQLLCKYTLKENDLTKLRDAIEDLYYFEFVIGKCCACFLLNILWNTIEGVTSFPSGIC